MGCSHSSEALGRNGTRTSLRKLLLIAWLLYPSNYLGGTEDVSVETIKQIKRSIVPIVCGYLDNKGAFQITEVAGSGFFIDAHGRFVTPSHVLDELENLRQKGQHCSPAIYMSENGWSKLEAVVHFQYFVFVGCIRNQVIDVAVCQPIENPITSPRIASAKIQPVELDLTQWPEGTAVAFTGFPLQFPRPVTSKGFVAGYMVLEETKDFFDVVVDKAAWPGASGSPVYLSNGKVIGMVIRTGKDQGAGLAIARSAPAIADFLSKNPATENK
jgi:S1-C subfamily serine protease